jgi:hypothetical protein
VVGQINGRLASESSALATQQSSLMQVAARTGGRAADGNDLTRAFRMMQEDSSYYELGYYLSDLQADGAYHSIPWDKPFYKYKVLHPLAWILERLISTPATHHAHHAATTDDGVGYYKGNFGNIFFLWDVIFETAHISRQYPKAFGISHYEGDPWYAQVFWPVFKSNIKGRELSPDGPVVKEGVAPSGGGQTTPHAA